MRKLISVFMSMCIALTVIIGSVVESPVHMVSASTAIHIKSADVDCGIKRIKNLKKVIRRLVENELCTVTFDHKLSGEHVTDPFQLKDLGKYLTEESDNHGSFTHFEINFVNTAFGDEYWNNNYASNCIDNIIDKAVEDLCDFDVFENGINVDSIGSELYVSWWVP